MGFYTQKLGKDPLFADVSGFKKSWKGSTLILAKKSILDHQHRTMGTMHFGAQTEMKKISNLKNILV